eukprot:CAMPEP_0172463388 /NCGR_PEP_ID=MMETSP1065-20121228/46990_1 /TAXON_ID=265537 /ORGANISM="Amphiprora paludosa, Strain CCMP125" /LENGTH=130 /DNA_ID=CAMNT_0013219313 /DNA_START=91 /DNA_END=480 /DNA_ORIENTATION=-
MTTLSTFLKYGRCTPNPICWPSTFQYIVGGYFSGLYCWVQWVTTKARDTITIHKRWSIACIDLGGIGRPWWHTNRNLFGIDDYLSYSVVIPTSMCGSPCRQSRKKHDKKKVPNRATHHVVDTKKFLDRTI